MKKIIVHNGTFHADDIISICMIRNQYGNDIPVERKHEITLDEFNDPDVWVVDVGGIHAADYHNFDHHQDKDSPSACILVAEALYTPQMLTLLRKQLLDTISDVDCGKAMPTIGSINSIVRNFNSLPNGFDLAVWTGQVIFDAYHYNVVKSIEDEYKWRNLFKGDGFALQYNTEFILGWKEYAEKDNIKFLVCPSARKEGEWNVISRDSEKFNIPADNKQTFRHTNGFIAVYSSYDDAVNAVIRMCYE